MEKILRFVVMAILVVIAIKVGFWALAVISAVLFKLVFLAALVGIVLFAIYALSGGRRSLLGGRRTLP
ncbi:MAG: hypothetical protein JST40_08025 [Armatimonadetes bacterium]|nr:hypothetical protein [Armatimonadota bacterium]